MALDVCEKHGLVHGNIDLCNIFVSASGTYKLGDVGIERLFAQQGEIKHSAFSAPEATEGICDIRSDIYSLGFIMSVLLKVNQMQKNSDTSKTANENDQLIAIINKACSEDPDMRYQSARLMLNDIEMLLGGKLIIRRSKKWILKALGISAALALFIFISFQIFQNFYSWYSRPSDHCHDYYYINSNPYKHWEECECGEANKKAYHTYSWMKNSEYHWQECSCGRVKGYKLHNYVSWDVITEATESSAGLKKSACKNCNYETSAVIPMIAHTHKYSDDWCMDDLSHWKECPCGNKSNSGSHEYGAWKVINPATITSEGRQERSCKKCGYVGVEVIPKIPHTHSFESSWKNDSYNHWHQCSCGDKTDVSAHAYGTWTVTKAATVYATGMKERSCKQCGYVDDEVIPKIQHTHSYTNVWFSDSTSHWHECNCGEKTGVSAHTFGDWRVIKAATSTAPGKQQRTCTICPYSETEVIPTNSHTHNFASGWRTNFSYHWNQCSCGEQENKEQHTFSTWVVTKEATSTSEGTRRRVCTVCGYTMTEQIPMLLEVDSISIASLPTKTEYVVGDAFNTEGLSLTVRYSNGLTTTIITGFECTPTRLNTVGKQTITVIYRGKTATFTVNVTRG